MPLNKKEIGIRLKEYRLYKGLTQEEMSELMGVSARQYQRYESGECLIERGIRAIDESIDYIISGVHSVDMLVDMALKIMPEQEYEINKMELARYKVTLSEDSEETKEEQVKSKDLVEKFDEYYKMLATYALKHIDKNPVREYEGPHIYTMLTKAKYTDIKYKICYT